MTLGKQSARKSAELSAGASSLSAGICVAINWADYLASVNVNGGTVDMPMVGAAPAKGDRVWVGFLGRQPVCLGPVPKPTTGTVTGAVVSYAVDVTGDDNVVYPALTFDSDYAPVDGNRVAISWAIPGGYILGRLSSDHDLPTPTTPDATAGQTTSRETTFLASQSGSFYDPDHNGSGTWQTNDVYCGDSNIGAFFYDGRTIADTIPDSATITSVRIYVDAYRTAGGAPTIGTHTLDGKSSAPTVFKAVSVAGGSGWKDLPTSFGDDLKTGLALGLATNHGGDHRWSAARTNNSGALTIRWEA